MTQIRKSDSSWANCKPYQKAEFQESEDSARPGPEVEKSQLVREPQMAPRDDNDFMGEFLMSPSVNSGVKKAHDITASYREWVIDRVVNMHEHEPSPPARHSLFFDPEDLVVDEATLEGIIQG